MKRLGICQKCGEEIIVRDHHVKGYLGDNKDYVVPYCRSCDTKAHNKAREEGRCLLTGEESNRLSIRSSQKRSIKNKNLFSKTVGTNIRLLEQLQININTKTITVNSYFQGNHGKKLKVIDEKEE